MKAVLITIIGLIIFSASPFVFADVAPASCAPKIPLHKIKPKLIPHPAPAPLMSATVYPGSLKYNITRIAANHGWSTVVWNYPADFNWVGQTHITAHNLQNIFIKLLSNYPLQAQFYHGNHVLVIAPRNLP